ncbi:Rap1 GTPase-activating protein 1 [Fragariocoptes setiger]|uniref:Rap1 GTPase-activating protein 1 n=1 Tax=Fragariocoptes setiger TaxID=1670756 RepID=A0ABQ7SD52_9ACAR|nr:Rap1 GTPase-activating protein 1 [Fragariocoptes setiger]
MAEEDQRCSNLICDSEVFLTKLREFKPQSLGCLEARRKSSSTLIFPNPPQACVGPPKCPNYPHGIKPTPGYWIECHGPGPEAAKNTSAQTLQEQSNLMSGGISKSFGRFEELRYGSSSSSAKLNTYAGDESAHLPASPNRNLSTEHKESTTLVGLDPSNSGDRPGAESSVEAYYDSTAVRGPPFKETAQTRCSNSRGTMNDSQMIGKSGRQSSTSMSKKRTKRTMTKDDIDLHKTRRGTPNITITEPSFNQSTTSYSPLLRQERMRPAGARRRVDSIESASSHENHQIDLCSPTAGRNHSNNPAAVTSAAPSESPDLSRSINFKDEMLYQIQDSLSGSLASNYNASHTETTTPSQSPALPSASATSGNAYSATSASPAFGAAYSSRATSSASSAYSTNEQMQQTDEHGAHLSKSNQISADQRDQPQSSYGQPITGSRDNMLELISFEEENYEKHYYGREHWNYFTNDEMLGPVMLSLKQEVNNQRDHFHVLLRTVSYTLHGTIPACSICADRYDREAIVRELSEIAKLKPPLMLGQLPSTPDELLKLDHMFIKSELKVGVIYIKDGQANSEEAILGNREESPLFAEFLDTLGERIRLKGFDRYKGGLDTVHNLTGTESIYTLWRNIEIMFHVSTMLPHEENDPQKLQKKRHIGNDIVCVAFIESDDTLFWPGCIKSYFLHTFITVRTSPKPLKPNEKRKYIVSCVCRNEVQHAFKPYLSEQDEFEKSEFFRDWLMVKIVNGERASYSAPKFARMQDRTRSQMLEDIITNLANHLVTGQIPKPYRRGSWRPLGHTRASSPLEDSMKDFFEDYDQLAKDFGGAFCGPSKTMLCDVVFNVMDKPGKNSAENKIRQVYGVRAILAIRSRVFLEMLYGFVPPGGSASSSLQNQMNNLRAIELRALGSEGPVSSRDQSQKTTLAKRGSVGPDLNKRIGEKERRQSMIPTMSRSGFQKPNYLTVPTTSGGVFKQAFNRLVSGNWSGWGGSIKKNDITIRVDHNNPKVDLNSLALCKEIAKIDAERLAQKEFNIIEFDYDTFQATIEYIHSGTCRLSYDTIPGLICAAEHYDLSDLLHACFHHANTHMRLSAAPRMLNELENYTWRYVAAMQLLNLITNFIDPQAKEFFERDEYLILSESMLMSILTRKTLQLSETRKFQVMLEWAKHHVLTLSLTSRDKPSTGAEPSSEDIETINQEEFRKVMRRLTKDINLDKIPIEDLVKIVLPARVIDNKKLFNALSSKLMDDDSE